MAIKLIIIGAGFGGLKLARELNNKKGFDILLIDKFNYHQFQPLFYQVATAGLDASNISFPLRKVFQHSKNVRVRMAEIKSINTSDKKIQSNVGEFEYDVLVIATGAGNNFFGNLELQQHAFPMKSTVEALQIRNRLLQNFEKAVMMKEPATLKRAMNVVIAGGGPTGVEMSGAIADMRRFVLPKDYPELDFSMMNIYLLEGSDELLGAMSDKSSSDALNYLTRLGVIVKTGTLLAEYDGKTARMKSGESIETSMLIWAAGIKGNLPEGINENLIVKGNRVKVDRHCCVLGLQDVYAIGDIAYMEEPAWPQGHPQVASVAIQMGDMLADNLVRYEMKSGKRQILEFTYNDKGAMATVGRNLAVVDIPKPKLHFKGIFAWLIWMGLHLMLILGVKNRFFVFFNWVYNYFTRDQNLRLIFKAYYKDDIENEAAT